MTSAVSLRYMIM